MAEGTSPPIKSEASDKNSDLDCPVCLQKCVHPAQLPCGHVFCFLCVKGIANRSKRCAMCRQEIPADFIEQPKLLFQPETKEAFEGVYQWFYEGRNGWWQYDEHSGEDIEQAFQLKLDKFETLICAETYVIDFQDYVQYPKSNPSRKRSIKRELKSIHSNIKGVAGWWQYDERTSRELEACYKSGEKTCELLIAGFLYIADLDAMIQMRRNDHSRSRRIKRDFSNVPRKGVAGLRTPEAEQVEGHQENSEYQSLQNTADDIMPATPSNTPQTPASGNESPQHEDIEITIERMRTLWLDRIQSAIENNEPDGNDE